jgi:peptidoglycan/LPS O-acetylase OafA/YrhL
MHYFMPDNSFWVNSQNIFMLIGLGIFTFISGLLVDLNYSKKVKSFSDILVFYKERAIRILPLNWISIILSVLLTLTFVPLLIPILVQYYPIADINFLGLFSQFIGSQLLVQNSDSFNWFVGLIVVCYFIYPIVVKFSNNIIQTICLSLLPLLIILLLRLTFGLIDDRLLIFYMIFVGGVIVNQLNQSWNNHSNKRMALYLIVSVVSSFIFYWRGGVNFYNHPLFNNPFINFVIYEIILLDVAIISGCMFLLLLLNRTRMQSILEKCGSIITFIAVSSYCVYLFHFSFFTIGEGLIEFFKLPAISADILFYLLIIPLTFLLSYCIQTKERAFWKRLQNRHSCMHSGC